MRRRVIRDAQTLLRLIFAYCWGGLSARQTCSWAAIKGICRLSNVALLERLQFSAKWLAVLVTQMLSRRCSKLEVGLDGRNLRIVDASCINRAGSEGTDRRLHLGFALRPFCIDCIEITDSSGGESLGRFAVDKRDVLICDRGYAHRGGVWAVACAGADVVVRLNWQNFPLLDPEGKPFDILEHLRSLKDGEAGDWDVRSAPDPAKGIGSVKGRLIAVRKSEQAAERERRKIRHQAQKRGRTPDARTLEAADYIFIFTTLSRDEASAEDILELYRFRWQIEIAFKRLKGILHIDEIPACSDELLDTILLSRLLAALVIEDLASSGEAFSPWGYGLPASGEHKQALYCTDGCSQAGGAGGEHAWAVAQGHPSAGPVLQGHPPKASCTGA